MKQMVMAALCVALAAGVARAQGLPEDVRHRAVDGLEGIRERQRAHREGLRYADPNERRPGRRAEASLHTGGQFRLDFSSGYLWYSASIKDSGDRIAAWGPVMGPRLHVGYAVARDVVLGLQGISVMATNPTARQPEDAGGGVTVEVEEPLQGSLWLLGFGPELTLYSDSDWSLTLAAALTSVHLQQRYVNRDSRTRSVSYSTETSTSDWGFGGAVALGKEWWIAQDVSLGLTLHLTFSAANDFGDTKRSQIWITGGGLAVTFE